MKREIGCTSCVLSTVEADLARRRCRRRDHLVELDDGEGIARRLRESRGREAQLVAVPTWLTPRLVKVATPSTAVAVVAPVSVAPAGPVPGSMDAVTTVVLSAASVTPLR